MAEILEQLNNLKELGYIQKAHLNVLEVALEDYKTEIRAKAIDEFAKWCYVNGIDFSYMRKSTDTEPFVKTVIKRFNEEQMKAGGKNE